MNKRFRNLKIRQIDEKLRPWHELSSERPRSGWIRTVREALGMTTTQLAERLGRTKQSVAYLEERERAGKVTIGSLQRAAEEMDCDFVYAIVPRGPLEYVVAEQAKRRAVAEIEGVAHSMRLEAQGVDRKELDELVGERTASLLAGNWKALWVSRRNEKIHNRGREPLRDHE